MDLFEATMDLLFWIPTLDGDRPNSQFLPIRRDFESLYSIPGILLGKYWQEFDYIFIINKPNISKLY